MQIRRMKPSGSLFNRAIDIISGIFQPILGIMAACGMVKGLNALFVALGWYPETCGGYLVLNAIGDGLFHFLPLFLGYTAAKKFRLKPMHRAGNRRDYVLSHRTGRHAFGRRAGAVYTVFRNDVRIRRIY